MATEYKLSYTGSEINAKLGKIDSLAEKSKIPTNISQLNNDSGFITSYTETDPTVPAWAKVSTKPTYTASEVGADASGTANSLISAHNTATDAHTDIRTALNNKLSSSELQTAINTSLAQAKASGEFDGQPGKTAYAYAQDGGYTGTEEEFAAKLASEDVSAPADWNAAEGEPGHILNRTHWRDLTETVLFEQTVTIIGYQFMDTSGASIPLNVGETYTVVWDGVSYEAVAKAMDYNGFDAVAVGNAGIIPTTGAEDTGEPFLIITVAGAGYGMVCLTDGEHTIVISGNEYTYHTIPPEYLAGSKPFYIDLKTDENLGIIYETDVTENDIKNALTSGYQVVVRRTQPQWGLSDLFFMDRRINDGTLYFYRITGRHVRNDIEDPMDYEFLQFTPNDVGGYDITRKRAELVQKSDFPTALKNPNALTINGVSYDGSATKDFTDAINTMIDSKLASITSAEEVAF